MDVTLFTAMIALFWVAEFAFAALVVYWFVTQGFSEEGATVDAAQVALEDREFTMRSLAMWGGFFAFVVLLIVVGA